MANTPDLATCIYAAEESGELLPLSPFYALNYHSGMLLGVDDFETEQAYHRSKMRLHNAWLHREGVVWGMDVRLGEVREEVVEGQPTEVIDLTRGEIRVTRGLALDAAGHELHLETDACLHLPRWFEEHQKDPELEVTDEGDGVVSFDAHVVIRFKACLTRQVPALIEPCDGAGSETAYSRIFETVEVLLRPGLAPPTEYPYHRLRLLFALEEPILEDAVIIESDQEVLDERANILAQPPDDQPAAHLRAFRRFAALDEIDLQPATSSDGNRTLLFPATDDQALVLANVSQIRLDTKDKEQGVLLGGEVDVTVRPSHVATATIQELLCGPLFRTTEAAETGPVEDAPLGPTVDPNTVEIEPYRIRFRADCELHQASVKPDAFSVTWFNAEEGWHNVIVGSATYEADQYLVNLELKDQVAERVRLIVRGTGPTPIVGADLLPLAGALGSTAAALHDGRDFVYMTDFTPEVGDEIESEGAEEGN